MSRARSEGDTPRQNGSAGRKKADQRHSEDGENDPHIGSADLQDDDNDPSRRREIRSKYRDLISSVQRE